MVGGGNDSRESRHATEVGSLNAALESERKELESARLEADL